MAQFNPVAITPVMHNGEVRILDVDLAKRLGFEKATKIRELIKRHTNNLEKMGPLPTVGRVINGGKAREFYLNRKQAIFITAKSETPEATDITIEIIERFDAYERNERSSYYIPKDYSSALRLAAEQEDLIQQLSPKATAYMRIADAEGSFCLTDAAKTLQVKRIDLINWLQKEHWIYRRVGNKNWLAYQDKLASGCLIHKIADLGTDSEGFDRIREQVRITAKGLTKISEKFSPFAIN
ncbi:phage antirepressor KilAC domain-containing protein [Entomobacter blattae]|uniref:Phage antirepressor protein KilAC domain protein n=1 Tax=Entomobacter blattae TaxID=2762277 RepID=A0A7H1NUF6_9PROT|nr:phage antirepressor KilAC domain-containing protein [Entomobacter blattae]QNT79416.1 Phage antirepressor protein KilAC domain protein [Entomobacter blattae]